MSRENGSAKLYNLGTAKDIITLTTLPVTGGKFKPLPRVFSVKNIEGSEDLYEKCLPHIGGTFRFESDSINGLFNLSLEKEDIVFTEVLH